MRIQTFFKRLTSISTRRRPIRRSPPASRLCLETLEDRWLPSFTAGAIYPVESNPMSVATADFNGDGPLDLVIANNYSNTVSVLVGKADGTFAAAQSFATGYSPLSVAVGDLNGDGKIDIVTANSSDLSVLQNAGNDASGNPTFQAAQSLNLGSNPLSVTVGDLNADGLLDLVATSFIYYGGGGGGWYGGGYGGWYGGWYSGSYGYTGVDPVNVLLGTGVDANANATFSGPTIYTLASNSAAAVVVADVNGDGQPDVVTANSDISTVSVLLNTVDGNGVGTGALQTPIDFAVGAGPLSVAVGDFNGDGTADVVTANSYANTVSVLLGNGLDAAGNLTFKPAQDFAVGASPTGVAVADLNQDLKDDIVATTSAGVTVLLGDGDGGFLTPDYALAGQGPRAVAVGDFNGDGSVDLAVANANSADVAVLTNTKNWPAAGAPSISISDATITEGNTGTKNLVFTVTLSAASTQTVTVHYATANGTATAGSDYTDTSGTLTIAANKPSGTFSVPILGDRIGEPNETFLVLLSQATNAFTADPQAVGMIVDDEPRLSIGDATITEGNTGTKHLVFTVTLSAKSDQDVTVHYNTADFYAIAGSDYADTSGTLTIKADKTTETFFIPIIGDRLAEYTESFRVSLSQPTNALITDSEAIGTIVDDEPRISIGSVSMLEGRRGQTLFVFTVSLSAAYDQDVTVNYNTADGSATVANHDYQATSGTLTIPAGKTTATFTVTVYGDNKFEWDEYFYVNLSGASSNAMIENGFAYGDIRNDDFRRK